MDVKNIWQSAPAHAEPQWASIWLVPRDSGQPEHWPFTVDEVIERLNEWLNCLGSKFRFVPDPRMSNDHYAIMVNLRDNTQAIALSLLGQMAAQTLFDERKG